MMSIAPSGQALAQSPQPIQPNPQISLTRSSSSSLDEHGIKLVASLGIILITPLYAGFCICAGAAAGALVRIDDYVAVIDFHRAELAVILYRAAADAATLALASDKAFFYRFSAGCAVCESRLSGSITTAGDKSDLIFCLWRFNAHQLGNFIDLGLCAGRTQWGFHRRR